MIRLWLFLHLLGFTMWLGGGIGAMFAAIAARRESGQALSGVVRGQAAVQRLIIGPGALITVLSGLMLTLNVERSGAPGTAGPWLMVMQVCGLAAGLLTLFVTVPTSARLARLDPEVHGAVFERLRSRMRIVGAVSGSLGLVALLAGSLL
ncbi:MAG TPA: DUF2269 family protein [Gemmatimonadales bacterium]|nr:DUF2269 family protein [Gemmatimonadales bacterium]